LEVNSIILNALAELVFKQFYTPQETQSMNPFSNQLIENLKLPITLTIEFAENSSSLNKFTLHVNKMFVMGLHRFS